VDGVGRMMGGNYIRLAGVAALMRATTLRHIAICENWLLSNKPNLADAVTEGALRIGTEELARRVRERAIGDIKRDRSLRVITADRLQDWLESIDGLSLTAWLSLRGRHPLAANGFEEIKSHFRTHRDEAVEFKLRRDVCSGMDLLGHLDWPEPYRGPNPQKVPKPKYIAWRKMFKFFAQEYGFSPREVGCMTLYALNTYCMDNDNPSLGGTASVSADQARILATIEPEDRVAYLAAAAAENPEV
jgi:hypothetical protein